MQKFNVSSIVLNRVREVRDMVERLYVDQIKSQEFFDIGDEILNWEGVAPILKYNGVYYKKDRTIGLSKVLAANGVKMSSDTLKTIMGDRKRWDELWGLGIQTHYIKKSSLSGEYYICTDGVFFKKERPLKNKMNNSYISIRINGEPSDVNRAKEVLKEFRYEITEDKIFWNNGLFGDCGLDNVREKDYKNSDFQ